MKIVVPTTKHKTVSDVYFIKSKTVLDLRVNCFRKAFYSWNKGKTVSKRHFTCIKGKTVLERHFSHVSRVKCFRKAFYL